jgi:hypothetical protein
MVLHRDAVTSASSRVVRRSDMKTAAHLRLELPKSHRSQMGVLRGQIFLVLPDGTEVELPKVRSINTKMAFDDVTEVELTFLGTLEIVYKDGA